MQAAVKQRVQSIDIVRGIIIIIMTLDHVRDFLHIHAMDGNPLKLDPPDTLLFFTRWITHYCAPTFVFLSGVSAWLAGQRRTKKELSAFLLKRGFWLVLSDIVLMSFAFSLNPTFNLIILEVLWAIGIGMILLGLLVNTSPKVIAVAGALIFFGHNLLDYVQLPADGFGLTVRTLFTGAGALIPLTADGGWKILVGYAPISWAGVLLLGYTAGQLYNQARFSAQQRQKVLFITGLSLVALFIILRWINKYGDPAPWATRQTPWATFLSFLNVSKYPPSLSFCCITLGPVLILLALAERFTGRLAAFFTVYGKVPYFYFIGHFYLIRLVTVIAFFATGFQWKDRADPASLFLFRPVHFGFSIGIVYLLWVGVFLAMYYPAKWFNKYRATHSYWWLKYC